MMISGSVGISNTKMCSLKEDIVLIYSFGPRYGNSHLDIDIKIAIDLKLIFNLADDMSNYDITVNLINAFKT